MRIDVLKKLTTKSTPAQSKFIMLFLDERFSLASEDEEVTYQDFIDYLHEIGVDIYEPIKSTSSVSITDAELFSQFLTQEKKYKAGEHQAIIKTMNSDALLNLIPKDVRENELAKWLDVKSVANLSATCSALYNEAKGIAYWRDKLIEAGCNKDLLKKVVAAGVIQNYKNLYRAFTKLLYAERINIYSPWEFFYLSGEPRAMHYAIEHDGFTVDTKNINGETGFHLACLSGSPVAIEKSLAIKDGKGNSLNLLAKSKLGRTGFHYACWSGSPAAIEKSLAMKDANGASLDPLAKSTLDTTGFHYACLSGSPAAIEKSLAIKDANGNSLDLLAKNNLGRTGFHYACLSGSPAAIDKILAMKDAKGNSLDFFAKTNDGDTGFHLACQKGSPAAIEKSLAIKDAEGKSIDPLAKNVVAATGFHLACYGGSPAAIEKSLAMKDANGISLDPLAKNSVGATGLHYACWGGSPLAVMYLRHLSCKFALGFDSKSTDVNGHDAFWYANCSDNKALIKEALLAPIQDASEHNHKACEELPQQIPRMM